LESFVKNIKASQKVQLISEFAILIQPLVELARAKEPPSQNKYREAIAKVQAGDNAWREQVTKFTTFAPDIFYRDESSDISHVPEIYCRAIRDIVNQPNSQDTLSQLQEQVKIKDEEAKNKFFEYVDRIPIEWEPVLFEANTPFTSYLRIKEAIILGKYRVHYFDRYLNTDFFDLYLKSVDRNVSIRLVTTAGNAEYGVTAVSVLSKLAAKEFSDFKLIKVDKNDLHDRNLRVDNKIFLLGPSVDQAGIKLTNFGPSENSTEAHEKFDRIIANGHVIK